MPDAPRSQRGLAFPAFQTPAGLLPQAAREHESDYAETQGQAQELARRTDGVWRDLPYSPGRYYATPPALWVVNKKDTLARYKVVGAQLSMAVNVSATLTLAPSINLIVELPDRLRARASGYGVYFGSNPAGFPVLGLVNAGSRTINYYKFDFSNWVPGPVQILGQPMVIEVEEV